MIRKKRKREPKQKPPIPPLEDRLISFPALGERWDMHEATVRTRVKQAGIPVLRLSYKTSRLRMKDILEFEEQSISAAPKFQTDKAPELHRRLAEKRAADKAAKEGVGVAQ